METNNTNIMILVALIISILGGIVSIITIISYIRKSEKRLTTMEIQISSNYTHLDSALDNICLQIKELKEVKEDRQTLKYSLENVHQKLEFLNVQLTEIKVIINKK